MRLVLVVAIAVCACRSSSRSEVVPAEASPEPSATRPLAAADSAADSWAWSASKCLAGLELPVPPQWHINEITTGDDRCISSVSPADRTGVNVERSTLDVAATKAGIAKSWEIRSVLREQITPNGWFLVVDVGRTLVYAHRTDLNITCLSLLAEDIETVRRVCADARRP